MKSVLNRQLKQKQASLSAADNLYGYTGQHRKLTTTHRSIPRARQRMKKRIANLLASLMTSMAMRILSHKNSSIKNIIENTIPSIMPETGINIEIDNDVWLVFVDVDNVTFGKTNNFYLCIGLGNSILMQ